MKSNSRLFKISSVRVSTCKELLLIGHLSALYVDSMEWHSFTEGATMRQPFSHHSSLFTFKQWICRSWLQNNRKFMNQLLGMVVIKKWQSPDHQPNECSKIDISLIFVSTLQYVIGDGVDNGNLRKMKTIPIY